MTFLQFVDKCLAAMFAVLLLCGAAHGAPKWVDFGGAVMWPGYWPPGAGVPTFNQNMVLNDGNDNAALIFTVPVTGYITQACFRVGTVTTGEDVLVDLQSVNEGMYKSGTRLHAGDTAIVGITTDSAQSIIQVDFDAIGDSASVSRGDIIALVVRKDRSDADAINIQINQGSTIEQLAYPAMTDSTTAIGHRINIIATWGIKINQRAVNIGTLPIDSISGTDIYDSTTQHANNPDEAGAIWTPKFPAIISGFQIDFRGTINVTNCPDATFRFYKNTTLIDSISIIADSANLHSVQAGMREIMLRKPCTVLVGTDYYCSISPHISNLDSDSGLTVYWMSVPDSSWWYATNAGPELRWAQRSDGDAWTTISNRRPFINIRIVQLSADVYDGRRRKLLMQGSYSMVREAQAEFARDHWGVER